VLVNLFSPNLLHNSNAGILYCRIGYAFSTFVFGLHLTLQYDLFPTLRYEESFWIILWCYRILTTATIMFFISITDTTTKSNNPTLGVSIMLSIVGCLHFIESEQFSGFKNLIGFLCFAWVVIFVIQQNYYIRMFPSSYSHFLYVNLYFIAFVFGFILRISFHYSPSNLVNKSFAELFPVVSIYSYVLIANILTVLPGWIAHSDVTISKNHIIATKKTYERYISHEMRTPLNAASMVCWFFINYYDSFFYKFRLHFLLVW
jgi:hypothetical protein